ncbi:heterokaryon incompatibility protein-domain-containing protein [Hypoxylon crocopeplum]|nr:heterokaryon incompatibility protein-domain-containing protein [Hypoxylon crocopeplum]
MHGMTPKRPHNRQNFVSAPNLTGGVLYAAFSVPDLAISTGAMNERKMSTSIYKPLDRDKQEIRLLYLDWFSRDEETITCWMTTTPFATSPHYAALSYVWGEQPPNVEITVNGTTFLITESLALALMYLRKTELFQGAGHFPLWADAICINQTDPAERGHQVKLMGSVFSGARYILSWLGASNGGIDGINFDMVRDVAAHVGKRGRTVKQASKSLTDEDFQWMTRSLGPYRLGSNLRMSKLRYRAATYNLARSPYWTRTWIVQEMVLASHPQRHLFFYGSEHINYHQLKDYNDFLDQIIKEGHMGFLDGVRGRLPELKVVWRDLRRFALVRHIATLRLVSEIRSLKYRAKKGSKIIYDVSQHCSSTDRRDAVYGLLGIVPMDMQPDYEKSVADVYREWFSCSLEKSDTMNMLRSAGIGYDGTDDLSSWVPNLSRTVNDRSIVGTGKWLFYTERPIVKPGNILSIHGMLLDTLSTVDHPGLMSNLLAMQQWFWWFGVDSLADSGRNKYVQKRLPPLQAALAVLHRGQVKVGDSVEYFPLKPSSPRARRFRELLAWGCSVKENRAAAAEKLKISDPGDLLQVLDRNVYFPDADGADQPLITVDPHGFPSIGKWTDFEWLEVEMDRNRHNAFFRTKDGYLGIGPPGTVPGDVLCVLGRLTYLAVLRPLDDSTWAFVGTCYVAGLSDDKAVQRQYRDLPIKEFNLR